MVPYVHVSDPGFVHPFGILVATGVFVGIWLATTRARKLGYDVDRLNSFITWMLLCGFVGGHMLDELFYHPEEIAKNPLSLIMLWRSLSSFGGFVGAFAGIVLWKYFWFDSSYPAHPWLSWIGRIRRRTATQPILPFADLILSVFPVAWVFGRMGCSSVHDHPGALARKGAFLAVEYPCNFPAGASPEYVAAHFTGPRTHIGPFIELLHGAHGATCNYCLDGGHIDTLRGVCQNVVNGYFPRYDLGLLEMLFTVCLATLLALTWRTKVPVGFYVVATALAYSPVRFAMDNFRITEGINADLRYGGLTPAQWGCIALFHFGLAMLGIVLRDRSRGVDLSKLVLVGSLSGEGVDAAKAELAAKAADESDSGVDGEDGDEADESGEEKLVAKR